MATWLSHSTNKLIQVSIIPVFKSLNIVIKSKDSSETQSNLQTARSCKISKYAKSFKHTKKEWTNARQKSGE